MPTIAPEYTWGFLLILFRTSGMLVSAPMLSHKSIPAQARIGMAVFFALVMLPLESEHLPAAPVDLAHMMAGVLSETLFGLAMGLAMQLVFTGLQMGSHILGVQMGFGLGSVYDPVTGAQFGAFDQFYAVLVALVFFGMNGHHIVIQAFAETLRAVPPGTWNPMVLQAGGIAGLASGLMITAVRVAMPIVVALFLTDVGMGFVAKTVPQANILVVGMPLKIGVGLIVLIAALPATSSLMQATIGGPLTGSSEQLLGVN